MENLKDKLVKIYEFAADKAGISKITNYKDKIKKIKVDSVDERILIRYGRKAIDVVNGIDKNKRWFNIYVDYINNLKVESGIKINKNNEENVNNNKMENKDKKIKILEVGLNGKDLKKMNEKINEGNIDDINFDEEEELEDYDNNDNVDDLEL